MWIDALKDLLFRSNYSCLFIHRAFITEAVYRKGTIGRAKIILKLQLFTITDSLAAMVKYVSVNKALVTQASSAIPVIPLYISLLYKIMKKKVHEGWSNSAPLFRKIVYRKRSGCR
jgi:enoyl-[acyl-carrier protein] reductase/trans-2-enoyl-CoA reductase (NAD+)